MASKKRAKMLRAERAKQFMPFSALKGLDEALLKREKILVPKIELSPDMADELNMKIREVETGKLVSVTYFRDGEYIKLTGMLAKVNFEARELQIVQEVIAFDDILSME